MGLSNVTIKFPGKNKKIAQGEIVVYKGNNIYKITRGAFFEVVVKKVHPELTKPEKWLEPLNNKIVYEDAQFRVFEERLVPGEPRPSNTNAQRITIRLGNAGLQVANSVKFAETNTHVVKHIETVPDNVVIEFKVPQN